ncbi:MAG: LEA type 2 family protein [Methanoregula sp.]|nr:LEA type 2 family protein [Methanoregula sp.]
MKNRLLSILLLFAILIFTAGCMEPFVQEPPIQEPSVWVSDITVSDISLETIQVNTTIIIFNPNPVDAKLTTVALDLYYLDDAKNYLGHGEESTIDVIKNGNTTVNLPVTIGNVKALKALGSLVQKGTITLYVNGSAGMDIKGKSFEKPFEQSKEFRARDFESLLPMTTIPGTSVNITEKLQQLRGFMESVRE